MDKVEEYASDTDHPARPAAQYLLDILRYTVTFEDVYAVAVYVLCTTCRHVLETAVCCTHTSSSTTCCDPLVKPDMNLPAAP